MNKLFLLVNYVGQRPRRSRQGPDKGGKKGRLRGEGDQIKLIDLRFVRWQVVGLGKRKKKARMNDDLRDRDRGVRNLERV